MLKTRVITALFLLTGLFAALFILPVPAWLTFCSLICAGGAWEWSALLKFNKNEQIAFTALAAFSCGMLGVGAGLDTGEIQPAWLYGCYFFSASLWLLGVPVWLKKKWQVRHKAIAAGVGLIVLLPPALALAHLRLLSPSPWLLVAALAWVWVADITAYFIGRALGRNKLAPSISPGKTWEGAIGAVLGVWMFAGAVFFFTGSGISVSFVKVLFFALLLVVLTAISIMGDLFESLLKRQTGVKDSGTLLPGHGGILDRIDSLTSTLPLIGLVALWLM